MEQLAQAAAKAATDSLLQQLNLDNRIENASSDTLEGKGISRVPPKRLQAKVIVNDQVRWVHGYNQQELFDDYVGLLEREGIILWAGQSKPMRFEEVLGFRWEDYDGEWLSIERAVIHPKRNMPEIKLPKTASSRRKIPCPAEVKILLGDPKDKHGFLVWASRDDTHETPISYTEARNVYNRIRDRFQLDGYSAHDFRDTCATIWRENGIPLDVIARLLGHAKSETTEGRYVKYREDTLKNVLNMM